MDFRYFIVPKIDKIKNAQLDPCEVCSIDINLWFKSNSLTPSSMNAIRQYIFEEWLHKKIIGAKNKINLGYPLVIVYDNPTCLFIDLLKEKISEILDDQFCDLILVE